MNKKRISNPFYLQLESAGAFRVSALLAAFWFAASLLAAPRDAHAQGDSPKEKTYSYGKNDEVGALNEMSAQSVLRSAGLVTRGKVYDLEVTRYPGMPLWPGHPPFQLVCFRTPLGLRNQRDQAWLFEKNDDNIAFISEVVTGTVHSGTHLDGLAHITTGKDNHWYNGFKASEHLGDWGPLKADAATIPPIVTRGVLIDVAAYKGVGILESGYGITPDDLKGALARQKTEVKPGDAVLIRTGVLSLWPKRGASVEEKAKAKELIDEKGGAGPNLAAVKWLVKEKGAILIGDDQAAFEQQPSASPTNPHPVHEYLLITNGVHIMELVYMEELARDRVYEFMLVVTPLKIEGATGSMIRPIAIR